MYVTVPQEYKSDKEKKKYLSSSSIRGLIGNTASGFPSYHPPGVVKYPVKPTHQVGYCRPIP
jgi:hypothetical protein